MSQQTYLPLPLNEDFQPIEIQLQNYQQKRDIDFKLIVLLILIIMLGILIRKEEEQLERQVEIYGRQGLRSQLEVVGGVEVGQQHNGKQKQNDIALQQNTLANNANTNHIGINQNPYKNYKSNYHTYNNNQPQSSLTSSEQNKPQNQHQQQLYPSSLSSTSIKNVNNNNNVNGQIFKSNLKFKRNIQLEKMSLQGGGDGEKDDNDDVGVDTNKQPITNTITTTTTTSNPHSKLLKKYIQFYLWFPFFIFALILYSCYQKQSTQSSILISVKTLGQEKQSQQVSQCAICITQITYSEPLAVLPCSKKHVFHSRCIKEWLLQKKTCPICRFDVRRFRNGER